MKKTLMIASLFAFLATPVFSQQNQDGADGPVTPPTAEEVDAAVSAINAMANDDQKVDAYCDVTDGEGDIKEGDTAAEEAFLKKMDAYINGLGEDEQLAFDISDTAEESSPEGKKLGAAFASLEKKCAAESEGNGADGGEAN